MSNAAHVRNFRLGLQQVKKQNAAAGDKLVRAVGLEAARGVVMSTPVDTGRARGNWQLTLEQPAAGEVERLDPNGGSTLQKAAAVLQRVKMGVMVWLHNGVPYIGVLEEGSATHAAHGMVTRTVERLRRWMKGTGLIAR